MSKRILVVESDETIARALSDALRQAGLEPMVAPDGASADDCLRSEGFSAALVGFGVPGAPWEELISSLRRTADGALLPVLLVGHDGVEPGVRSPTEALSVGADYYFHVPDDLPALGQRVLGWIGDAPPQAAAGSGRSGRRRARSDGGFGVEEETQANLPALAALREAHEAKRRAKSGQGRVRRTRTRRPARAAGKDRALDLVRDGEGLRARGRTDEAIDAYLTAAEMYEEAEKLDPALALYKLILHLDPTRADVALKAGDRAADAGRLADALAIYRRAADAAEKAERLSEAEALLDRMVELNPSDPELVLRQASLRAAAEQAEGAPAPRAPEGPAPEPWQDQLDEVLAAQDLRHTRPPIDAEPLPTLEDSADLDPAASSDGLHQGAGLEGLRAARDAARADVEAALEGLESLLAEGTERREVAAEALPASDPDFGRAGGAPAAPPPEEPPDPTPWLPAREDEPEARPVFHEVADLPTLPTAVEAPARGDFDQDAPTSELTAAADEDPAADDDVVQDLAALLPQRYDAIAPPPPPGEADDDAMLDAVLDVMSARIEAHAATPDEAIAPDSSDDIPALRTGEVLPNASVSLPDVEAPGDDEDAEDAPTLDGPKLDAPTEPDAGASGSADREDGDAPDAVDPPGEGSPVAEPDAEEPGETIGLVREAAPSDRPPSAERAEAPPSAEPEDEEEPGETIGLERGAAPSDRPPSAAQAEAPPEDDDEPGETIALDRAEAPSLGAAAKAPAEFDERPAPARPDGGAPGSAAAGREPAASEDPAASPSEAAAPAPPASNDDGADEPGETIALDRAEAPRRPDDQARREAASEDDDALGETIALDPEAPPTAPDDDATFDDAEDDDAPGETIALDPEAPATAPDDDAIALDPEAGEAPRLGAADEAPAGPEARPPAPAEPVQDLTPPAALGPEDPPPEAPPEDVASDRPPPEAPEPATVPDPEPPPRRASSRPATRPRVGGSAVTRPDSAPPKRPRPATRPSGRPASSPPGPPPRSPLGWPAEQTPSLLPEPAPTATSPDDLTVPLASRPFDEPTPDLLDLPTLPDDTAAPEPAAFSGPLLPASLLDPDPESPAIDLSSIPSGEIAPLAPDDSTGEVQDLLEALPESEPAPTRPEVAEPLRGRAAPLAHLLAEAGADGHTWPPTLSIEPDDVLDEQDDAMLMAAALPPADPEPRARPRGSSVADLARASATLVDAKPLRRDEEPPLWGDVGASHLAGPVAFEAPTVTNLLRPRPLTPTQGRLTSLVDALSLLARALEQHATGILHLQESVDLVLVEGVPAARRGKAAVQSLIRLLRETGAELGHAGLELLLHVDPERPVAVARELVARGKMDPAECTIYLARHLEDGVGALLDHRGGWWFEGGADVELLREELVPEPLGLDSMLADLVAARGPWDLVEGGLEPDRRFERIADPRSPLDARDTRFWRLIDGRLGLGDAGHLAGLAPERAAAFAGTQVVLRRLAALPPPRRPAADSSPWMPLLGAQTPGERYVPLSVPPATRRVRAMGALPHAALSELDAAGRIRALAELVRTSDYFTILGVDTQASKASIDRAHQQLRGMITLSPGPEDPELARLAREVIRSLDEARDVLKVPELKAAYLNHLRR